MILTIEDRLTAIEAKLEQLLSMYQTRVQLKRGMTTNEEVIIALLNGERGGWLPTLKIVDALPSNRFNNRNSEDETSIVRAHINRLRKKGFVIDGHRNQGYRLRDYNAE